MLGIMPVSIPVVSIKVLCEHWRMKIGTGQTIHGNIPTFEIDSVKAKLLYDGYIFEQRQDARSMFIESDVGIPALLSHNVLRRSTRKCFTIRIQETSPCFNKACYGCRLYSRHVLLCRWREDYYPDSHFLVMHVIIEETELPTTKTIAF